MGVLNHFAVLNIQPCNFDQGFVIGSGKLRNDSELSGGVDSFVWPVEIRGTVAVRVEVATVLVADSCVLVGVATEGFGACIDAGCVAGVWGEGVCGLVGLPEVHFIAAGA